MVEGIKNIIIECDRQNSIDTIEGIETGNKYNNSKWTNQLNPVFIPAGSQINLENALINIRGADSQSIEFYNKNVKGKNYTDNFSLLQIGYYMNHNGTNTLPVPCIIKSVFDPNKSNEDKQKTLDIEISDYDNVDPNLTTYINNRLGSYKNVYPFSYYTRISEAIPPIKSNDKRTLGSYNGNPNPTNKIVYNIGDTKNHINPYLTTNSQKLGIIIHEFKGFDRNARRADGLPIFDTEDNGYVRNETLQHAKQFTEEIQLNIKSGFRNPTSVADKMTLQLQNSQPSTEGISNTITPRIAKFGANLIEDFNNTADLETQQEFFFTYAFQGKAVKVFNANFTIPEQTNPNESETHIAKHYVYSNIAVQNPIWYENGSNLLMNTKTMNFNNDNYPMNNSDLFCRFNSSSAPGGDNGGVNITVNYPVIVLNRYRNLTGDNDIDNINNYDVYSEALLYPDSNGTHPKKLFLEILGINTTNPDLVRTYEQIDRTNIKNKAVIIFCEGRSDEPNNIDFVNISNNDYNQMWNYPGRFIDLNAGDNKKHSILWHKFFSFCRTTWADQNGEDWIVYNYSSIGFHSTICGFQKAGTLNTYDFEQNNHWDENITFTDNGQEQTEPVSGEKYNIRLRYNPAPHIDYYIILDNDDPYHKGTWFLGVANPFLDKEKYGLFTYDDVNKKITLRNSSYREDNEGLGDLVLESTHTGTLRYTHYGLLYGYSTNRGSRLHYSAGNLTQKFHSDDASTGTKTGSWEFDYLKANNGEIVIKNLDDITTYTLTPSNFDNIIPTGWNYHKLSRYNQEIGQIGFTNSQLEDYSFITEARTNDIVKSPEGFSFPTDGLYDNTNPYGYSIDILSNDTETEHYLSGRYNKYQVITTNIQFDLDNLKIIKDLFKNCEYYDGDKKTEREIKNDKEWALKMDIGRTDDNIDLSKGSDINNKLELDFNAVAPPYVKHRGTIGKIQTDTEGHPIGQFTDGVVYPRLTKTGKPSYLNEKDTLDNDGNDNKTEFFRFLEHKFEISTRRSWCDDSQLIWVGNKTYTNGIPDYPHNFVNNKPPLSDELSAGIKYCNDNDILVIPYLCGRDITANHPNPPPKKLCCGFVLRRDYVNLELFKIQNFTFFGFSPSSIDNPFSKLVNKQVSGTMIRKWDNNNGVLVRPDPPYAYPKYGSSYCNYVWAGAITPTIEYNTDKGKFEITNLHTPYMLNQMEADETETGNIVAKLNGNYNDFQIYPLIDTALQSLSDGYYGDGGFINKGIIDSLCGIYIKNIYAQSESTAQDIESSTDERAQLITYEKYYGNLWWKLGFKYHQLRPMSFKDKPFNNRFFKSVYNNYSSYERKFTITPFTTNSNINIAMALNGDMFGVCSSKTTTNEATDKETTITLNGLPRFRCGFSGIVAANFNVDSDGLTADSISVQIQNAFYRIYSNIPTDTINYQDGQGGSLSCIGIALRNYASSSYYYSYAMSFNATVSRDITLSNITTEIRGSDGRVIENLDERCCIIYKITNNITIGNPLPDPNLTLLNEIKNKIDEGNKILLESGSGELEESGEVVREAEQHGLNIGNSLLKRLIQKEIIRGQGDIDKTARNIKKIYKRSKNQIDKLQKTLIKGNNAKSAQALENFESEYGVDIMINDSGDLVDDYEEYGMEDESFRMMGEAERVVEVLEDGDFTSSDIKKVLRAEDQPETKESVLDDDENIRPADITKTETLQEGTDELNNLSVIADVNFEDYIKYLFNIDDKKVEEIITRDGDKLEPLHDLYDELQKYINGGTYMRLDDAFDMLKSVNASLITLEPELYKQSDAGQRWVHYIDDAEIQLRTKKEIDDDDKPIDKKELEQQDRFRLDLQAKRLEAGEIDAKTFGISRRRFIEKYGEEALQGKVNLDELTKSALTEEEQRAYDEWDTYRREKGTRPRGRRPDLLKKALSKMTEIGSFSEDVRTGRRGRPAGALQGITSKFKREKLRELRKQLTELSDREAREIKQAQIKELQGRKLTVEDQRKLNWFNKNVRPIVKKFIEGQGKSGMKLSQDAEKRFREMIDNLTAGYRGKIKPVDYEILQYGVEGMLKSGFKEAGRLDTRNRRENILKVFRALSSKNTDPERRQNINKFVDRITESRTSPKLKNKLLRLFSLSLTKSERQHLTAEDIERIYDKKISKPIGKLQMARVLDLENRVLKKDEANPTLRGRQKEDTKYLEKVLMGREPGIRTGQIVKDEDLLRREGKKTTLKPKSIRRPAEGRTKEDLEKQLKFKIEKQKVEAKAE